MARQGDQAMTSSGTASPWTPDKDTAKEALAHFATAFAFLSVGLGALIWNSGRLSQGMFSDPRVLGGLHFVTLGWLSLSIFGALRVFTGVALGSQGYGERLVPWIRRLWSAGAVLFPLGLMAGAPPFILTGVLAIGCALILFTIHIVPALHRAKRGGLTRGYLALALISLWGTWVLGAGAALARAGHPIPGLPSGYFQAHVLLAVFGWVGATIVGVGSHLIPMFALSRDSTTIPVRFAFPFWSLLPLFSVVGAVRPDPFLILAWGAAGIGSALWLVQVAIYLRKRLRMERDPGLVLAGGSTLFLGAAWVTGIFFNAPIGFVGLLVLGWLTLFTLGIYHRVIPFLIWFVRFARRAGRGPVPKVKELTSECLGMATAAASFAGVAIWMGGLLLHEARLAVAGSSLILCGCGFALGQLKTLFGAQGATNSAATTGVAKGGAVV